MFGCRVDRRMAGYAFCGTKSKRQAFPVTHPPIYPTLKIKKMSENLMTEQPKKQMKKSFSVKVRLNEEEKIAFDELAQSLNVRPSQLHRRLIREAVLNKPDYFNDDLKRIIEVKNQMAAIGRNLNQLVKLAHSGHNIRSSEALEIVTEVKDLTLQTRDILAQDVQNIRDRNVKRSEAFNV